MNKILNIAPWILIIIYLSVVLTLISAKKATITCNKVEVEIQDETSNYFIEETDVLNMLNDRGEALVGSNIEDINVNNLESFLSINPLVKSANVYRTYTGEVHLNVTQRNPIVRVINRQQESFYLDDAGAVMPLSNKYTAHVLVASGDIDLSYTQLSNIQNTGVNDQAVNNSPAQWVDLYSLASYIYQHEFWRAQIEQIYVNGNEFELVPRVGTHLILLGDLTDYKKKFQNLKALYQQGFSKVGWNNYSVINLKYNKQVICTKR